MLTHFSQDSYKDFFSGKFLGETFHFLQECCKHLARFNLLCKTLARNDCVCKNLAKNVDFAKILQEILSRFVFPVDQGIHGKRNSFIPLFATFYYRLFPHYSKNSYVRSRKKIGAKKITHGCGPDNHRKLKPWLPWLCVH